MKNLKLLSVLGLSLLLNFTSFAQTTVTLLNTPCTRHYMSDYLSNGVCTTNIVVPAKNTLIVTGLVRMATNTKITLEPGAILYMDGATITHEDDVLGTSYTETKFWHGIEAKGDPTKAQDKELQFVCVSLSNCISGNDHTWTHGCCGYIGNSVEQAIVYMNNSKIRYSYVGISAGDKSFGLNNNSSLVTLPYGTQGGALLYVKNSQFENNFETCLTFAPYPNFPQSSVIQNSLFYSQFNNGYHLTKPSGGYLRTAYIKTHLNDFKHEIKGNNFVYVATTNYYPKDNSGLMLYSSSANIKENTFSNLDRGVELLGGVSRLVRRVKINKNTFQYCGLGIVNKSKDAITAKENSLLLSEGYFPVNAVGIAEHSPALSNINKNSFYNFSSQLQDNWGIAVKGNGFIPNRVNYNTTLKLKYSFHSEDKNTNLQLICNTFTKTKLRDFNILNDPGIGNQGSSTLPNGNKFSAMTSGQWNILNGATSSINYYYGSGLREEPNPKYNVSTISASNDNTCPTGDEYYTPTKSICNAFAGGYIIGMVTNGNTIKGIYDDLADDMVAIEAGGVQASEEDEYNRLINAYDLTLADLVEVYSDIMLADSMPDSTYRDTIVTVLGNHKTFTGNYLLLQFLLAEKNYTAANALISTLRTNYSTDADVLEYCDYMELMVLYAQSGYSNLWLKNNFTTLKTMADNDGVMADKAKVLTQAAVDTDSTNTYYGTTLYQWQFTDTSGSLPTDTSGLEVTKYPNPFTSTISVDIKNTKTFSRSFNVLLKDLQGNQLDIEPKTVGAGLTETVVLSSGSSPTGYYYVYVEESGTVIYYGLVYKN